MQSVDGRQNLPPIPRVDLHVDEDEEDDKGLACATRRNEYESCKDQDNGPEYTGRERYLPLQ